MRITVSLVVAAVLLGGCASWQLAPYNGRAVCEVAGGIYTGDGRCLAGSQ
jgi:hypothetical protein